MIWWHVALSPWYSTRGEKRRDQNTTHRRTVDDEWFSSGIKKKVYTCIDTEQIKKKWVSSADHCLAKQVGVYIYVASVVVSTDRVSARTVYAWSSSLTAKMSPEQPLMCCSSLLTNDRPKWDVDLWFVSAMMTMRGFWWRWISMAYFYYLCSCLPSLTAVRWHAIDERLHILWPQTMDQPTGHRARRSIIGNVKSKYKRVGAIFFSDEGCSHRACLALFPVPHLALFRSSSFLF